VYVLPSLISGTTELGQAAKLSEEWKKRGVKVIGLSCDSLPDHHSWIEDINETQDTTVDFPMIADADRSIAITYNML
jgi:alkyl hydroperoxide reductase subunit AhpC